MAARRQGASHRDSRERGQRSRSLGREILVFQKRIRKPDRLPEFFAVAYLQTGSLSRLSGPEGSESRPESIAADDEEAERRGLQRLIEDIQKKFQFRVEQIPGSGGGLLVVLTQLDATDSGRRGIITTGRACRGYRQTDFTRHQTPGRKFTDRTKPEIV